ncbi:MAG: hypothetical protein HC825_01555 [Oscillatoriales cyanobacterium RM1_1_9]|nr:hypothetical protein [Oscillatoriales cyanobacterium SM2_3_0]NJO45356.1 hypothetical protein [Oscillatoriales cyanobacterium RM2_1_1]NJO70743.1 hypothetical protein [Oscillatoriales cyanobacterium RM1_1_9]
MWLENLSFFAGATSFLVAVGWIWRNLEPFDLPSPLPNWFKVWFRIVQIFGVFLPLVALIGGGVWRGNLNVLVIFLSYFLMLGLQILTEIVSLRKFQTVIWVMIPYLYLPYRIWQLYEGLGIVSLEADMFWVRILLISGILLWMVNYLVNLIQLPQLLRWKSFT